MSDETQVSPAVDPLSQAAGGIDTTFPLLQPDRIMRLKCSSSKVAPSKENAARNTFTIICETTTDATFQDGKPARKGFKLYKRYGVSETEAHDDKQARTNKEIAKDLAFVLKAFNGPTTNVTPRDLLNNPSQLEGKVVDARIVVEKGSGGFPDKNGMTFIIPAT